MTPLDKFEQRTHAAEVFHDSIAAGQLSIVSGTVPPLRSQELTRLGFLVLS